MGEELKTRVMPINTPDLFATAVREAAELLRAGEIVALPTETVYGLAANALDPSAVARIYKAKGRPGNNPIIVHVASIEMARNCAAEWPKTASELARNFWPGPLTLVLPRASLIPDLVTAGGPTVGLRWPRHPFIQAVIQECGFPLAAPSANPSNRVSPTTAEHVRKSLYGRIPLIVDGGTCPVGIESTVLDLTVTPVQILRPGMIHAAALEAVIKQPVEYFGRPGSSATHQLRSPGQLPRHYAPRTPLVVLSWEDDAALLSQLQTYGLSPKQCWIMAHHKVPAAGPWAGITVMPQEPQAYARALYGELHACDEKTPAAIVVEAPPSTRGWEAIADRLRRASHRMNPQKG